jgi:hypothetical protein
LNDELCLQNFMGKRVDELETLKVGKFLYDVGNRTRRIKVPLFLART